MSSLLKNRAKSSITTAAPEWRNWQTRGTQNPVDRKARVGSIPSSGISYFPRFPGFSSYFDSLIPVLVFKSLYCNFSALKSLMAATYALNHPNLGAHFSFGPRADDGLSFRN